VSEREREVTVYQAKSHHLAPEFYGKGRRKLFPGFYAKLAVKSAADASSLASKGPVIIFSATMSKRLREVRVKVRPLGQQIPLIDDNVREIWAKQAYGDMHASLSSHAAWWRIAEETPLVTVKMLLLGCTGAIPFMRAYVEHVLVPLMTVDEATKQTLIAGRIWWRYLLLLDELSAAAARVPENAADEAPADCGVRMTPKQCLIDVAGDSLFRVPLDAARRARTFFRETEAPIPLGWTVSTPRWSERRLDLGERFCLRWRHHLACVLSERNQRRLESGLVHLIGLADCPLPERNGGWRQRLGPQDVQDILWRLAYSPQGWVFVRDVIGMELRIFDDVKGTIEFLEAILRRRRDLCRTPFSEEEMGILLSLKTNPEGYHAYSGVGWLAERIRQEPCMDPEERAQWRRIVGNLLLPDV